MNSILNITQSFYDLNSMKVNFDKSCIIMDNDSNIPLTFCNNTDNFIFTCPVIPDYESMRYLGVWISAKYNKKFIKNQLSVEISSFIDKIRFKPLTDKQLRYLNNMVLIPRLEYRSKLIVLSKNECEVLFRPMRMILKRKLRLRRDFPNAILHNKLAYGFNDLSANAMQAKTQQFINIINSASDASILRQTVMIRLKQIQLQFWLYDNPIVCWPSFAQHTRHENFLSNMVTEYFHSDFSFHNSTYMNHIFKIEGGELPLQNIVPWHLKTIKSLIKTRVLFLSQISTSGNFLFDFHDNILKTHNKIQRGGFIPAWYKILKTTVLSNPVNSMRLKPEFCTDLTYLEGYDCTDLIDFPKDIGWAAMWTPKENNIYNLPIPSEPIFGKFYKIKTLAPSCLFQHFNITNSTFDPRSPSKRTSVLVPCTGSIFNQNKQYYNIKSKLKSLTCAAFVDPLLPCPVTTSLLSNSKDRLHVLKRSIWPLIDQAIARFKNLNNTEVPYVFNDALNIDFDYISINRLFIDPDCINTLFKFKNRLLSENNLEFYTDGSHLFVDTSLTSYISSAFLLVHDNIDICYAAALTPIWANSTNTEIFALLLTLLICPFNSRITINTDSLNLILTYNRLVNTNASRYPFILLKTPFYLFWCFILRIIEQNQIALSLVKVKSHSGNLHNENMNRLAK